MFIGLEHRALIELHGEDKGPFLQGLITQDVNKLKDGQALYAALLTPQGKFLHDLFLIQKGESYFIDCERNRAPDLLKRLSLYKLRSRVTLLDCLEKYEVFASFSETPPSDAFICIKDPRHEGLGWRVYKEGANHSTPLSPLQVYDERRIQLRIPDGSRDMPIEKAVILEYGLDELGAIDWQKGCYMGQELMARTHYRGLIRKKLCCIKFDTPPPPFGTTITLPDGREGEMRTTCALFGLVLMRVEKSE